MHVESRFKESREVDRRRSLSQSRVVRAEAASAGVRSDSKETDLVSVSGLVVETLATTDVLVYEEVVDT